MTGDSISYLCTRAAGDPPGDLTHITVLNPVPHKPSGAEADRLRRVAASCAHILPVRSAGALGFRQRAKARSAGRPESVRAPRLRPAQGCRRKSVDASVRAARPAARARQGARARARACDRFRAESDWRKCTRRASLSS